MSAYTGPKLKYIGLSEEVLHHNFYFFIHYVFLFLLLFVHHSTPYIYLLIGLLELGLFALGLVWSGVQSRRRYSISGFSNCTGIMGSANGGTRLCLWLLR